MEEEDLEYSADQPVPEFEEMEEDTGKEKPIPIIRVRFKNLPLPSQCVPYDKVRLLLLADDQSQGQGELDVAQQARLLRPARPPTGRLPGGRARFGQDHCQTGMYGIVV